MRDWRIDAAIIGAIAVAAFVFVPRARPRAGVPDSPGRTPTAAGGGAERAVVAAPAFDDSARTRCLGLARQSVEAVRGGAGNPIILHSSRSGDSLVYDGRATSNVGVEKVWRCAVSSVPEGRPGPHSFMAVDPFPGLAPDWRAVEVLDAHIRTECLARAAELFPAHRIPPHPTGGRIGADSARWSGVALSPSGVEQPLRWSCDAKVAAGQVARLSARREE